MAEFDEDRASITGRKIASNIPPTIASYEQSRPYLTWLLVAVFLPVALLFFFVYLVR